MSSIASTRGRARLLLLASTALAAVSPFAALPDAALAQAIWQGTTTDYNAPSNWSTNSVPDSAGQSASFQNIGSNLISVTTAVAPDSWTFSSVQGYTLGGAAVTFGGAGIVNNSTVVNIANDIKGSGGVVQNNGGMLTLSGNNAYTGGTTINAGRLQLGNGGMTGSILGNVTLNGAGILAFNRSDNFSFNGLITGTGGVEQIGAGTTTLTNAPVRVP